jgi:hypothetical protein
VLPQNAAGTIRILPNPAYVDAGGSVTVTVWLEDVGNYYALDLRFTFEKAVVSVPSGETTPLWEAFDEKNNFLIKNTVTSLDATYDQVWYALTNLAPGEPFTGTGQVCAITFSGLAEGSTALGFTYAKAGTGDEDSLYPAQVDGLIVVRAPPEAYFDITLHPGWNLVSFPLSATPSSPRELFSSMAADYDLVYAWDAAAGSWESFLQALPDPQSLQSLDLTQGFWIHMLNAATLEVGGSLPVEKSIALSPGWNLVGFPASAPQAVQDALNAIDGKYSLVFEYDAADAESPWKRYDPNVPPYANTLAALTPGMGYWINATESCTWVVQY